MAKYCVEKFVREELGEGQGQELLGEEIKVCWRQDKHVHDASLITTIKRRLGETRGGIWDVRSGSYQSNQSSCPVGSIEYSDL